jgi:hypothetical protein
MSGSGQAGAGGGGGGGSGNSSPFAAHMAADAAGSASGDPGQAGGVGGSFELRPGEFHPRERSSLRSVSERRGGNWALPDATDKAFPVSRPIRIVCNADHLTILPDGRSSRTGRTIPLGSQTTEAVDELVSGVWDHMKGWGIAGQGLYWKPILVMEVTPAAGQRYEDLLALLSNSGLEVREKPTGKPTSAKQTLR